MRDISHAIDKLLQSRGQARCVAAFVTFKEEESKMAFLRDTPSSGEPMTLRSAPMPLALVEIDMANNMGVGAAFLNCDLRRAYGTS